MSRPALALAFFGALVPVSAEALSCVPWSPAEAFDTADRSPSRYSVVVGRFDFDPAALPGSTGDDPLVSGGVVPAVLAGRALSARGFDAPWTEPVALEVSCALSWCGTVLPGAPYLVFVEHKSNGLAVDLGPCPSVVFANPTPEMKGEITRCLTAKPCSRE